MSRRDAGWPSDGAMVALVALGAALCALVWAWGELAAGLLGRGWLAPGSGEPLEVLLHLPAHLDDPAAAWPPPAQARLPGASGCYAVLALLCLLVGALGWLLAASGLAQRLAEGPADGGSWGGARGGMSAGARWARRGELGVLRRRRRLGDFRFRRSLGAFRPRWSLGAFRPRQSLGAFRPRRSLGAFRPRRGGGGRLRLRRAVLSGSPGQAGAAGAARLVLGRCGRRVLAAEQRHALIAFGPPQSGKSAGLAIPALLEWPGPAVASSIKTDLLAATLARRQRLGRVFVFDPFELSGAPAHGWSPLHAALSWDGALEVAWRMAAAGELDQRGVEGGDFWAIAAEQRLAPLLYAAARSGGGIEQVVRWAYGQGARELDQAVAQMTGSAADEDELADAHRAYDAIRAFEAQADRTRSSIEATAQALLRAYRFRRVARSASSCEITADRLLDEQATLYLIGDAKASKLLRPLFLGLLGEVIDRAYERATRAGGRLALPLLLCLDEAGNVAPLPNLAEVASTAPSHNIQLVSIFHDLAQARSRYGRQAETVVNSHRARMLLPGVADLDTLRYFSGLVGEEEAHEQTRTTGAGGTTRSYGHRRRPLIAAEALRQLPDGHALLLYGRLAPVRVRLRMWFADRSLRRLAR